MIWSDEICVTSNNSDFGSDATDDEDTGYAKLHLMSPHNLEIFAVSMKCYCINSVRSLHEM